MRLLPDGMTHTEWNLEKRGIIMYQIGDLIIYGGTGVCRVEEIGTRNGGQLYYTLMPLYQSCKIFTPVENLKVFMRPIVSRQEADDLIDQIPNIRAEVYHSKAVRELTEHYEARLKTYNCRELLELTMSIYAKKQETLAQKRRIGAVEESFLRRAEDLLFSELAAALEIDRAEVQPYIAARVGNIQPAKQPDIHTPQ